MVGLNQWNHFWNPAFWFDLIWSKVAFLYWLLSDWRRRAPSCSLFGCWCFCHMTNQEFVQARTRTQACVPFSFTASPPSSFLTLLNLIIAIKTEFPSKTAEAESRRREEKWRMSEEGRGGMRLVNWRRGGWGGRDEAATWGSRKRRRAGNEGQRKDGGRAGVGTER